VFGHTFCVCSSLYQPAGKLDKAMSGAVSVTLYHGLHIFPMISFLSYLHYFLGVSHPLLNSKMNVKVRRLIEQCLEEHENHCMTVDGLQHIVTFEITLLMTGEMLVLTGCQEIALHVEN
jgi:hypothetical protein